jgi:hypothetical protein
MSQRPPYVEIPQENDRSKQTAEIQGTTMDSCPQSAISWITLWLGVRPACVVPSVFTAKDFQPPPTSLMGTLAADWEPLWYAGPVIVFEVLFGLHRCYGRSASGEIDMVPEEWFLWVADVGIAFQRLLAM